MHRQHWHNMNGQFCMKIRKLNDHWHSLQKKKWFTVWNKCPSNFHWSFDRDSPQYLHKSLKKEGNVSVRRNWFCIFFSWVNSVGTHSQSCKPYFITCSFCRVAKRPPSSHAQRLTPVFEHLALYPLHVAN